MTSADRLISLGSEPLAPAPQSRPGLFDPLVLGSALFALLEEKNGFYAFESALHIFPLTGKNESGLEAWNSKSLWRGDYRDLAEGLLFFAEDVFQDQFCLSSRHEGVLRFEAETGQVAVMADSIERWADVILSNYREETGWPLAHDWQAKNGPLAVGQRLMPKIPFFLGGAYDLNNLWAGDVLEGMRFKADLAMQTRYLPDGSKVKLKIAPRPG